MLEKSKYNLVEESVEPPAPSDSEGHSQHGHTFDVKFIGSLDIVRPRSRIEILAAMRRIRYEFKTKNIKKKKVNLVVSVDGVQVAQRKKNKKYGYSWNGSHVTLIQDPIFRIFYVSHDSQDLKIFSYIARDKTSNVFHCNVFKSKRKSQAMRIVRTIGQAFEVCHKQSLDSADAWLMKGEAERSKHDIPVPNDAKDSHRYMEQDGKESEEQERSKFAPLSSPQNATHQLQLLQSQLQQQEQENHAASAQVVLLQQQLSVESSSRTEAQVRVQQLLQQNTELLQHLSLLVKHVQELELRTQADRNTAVGSQDSLLEIALRPNILQSDLPSPPLDDFRFFTEVLDPKKKKTEQDQDSGQGQEYNPSGECSPPGNIFLSTMDIPGFRESGIGSGYESNTDDSDDHDSWGQ